MTRPLSAYPSSPPGTTYVQIRRGQVRLEGRGGKPSQTERALPKAVKERAVEDRPGVNGKSEEKHDKDGRHVWPRGAGGRRGRSLLSSVKNSAEDQMPFLMGVREGRGVSLSPQPNSLKRACCSGVSSACFASLLSGYFSKLLVSPGLRVLMGMGAGYMRLPSFSQFAPLKYW